MPSSTTTQQFLDDNQYSRKGIKRYEYIHGKTFLSTGGLEISEDLYKLLNLKPDARILDVGCGIGGSALYLARTYGANVTGIDISSNAIGIALEYRNEQEDNIKEKVSFEVADIINKEIEPQSVDVVISRDVILHIDAKLELFRRLHKWLKPDGQLLITDMCRAQPASEDSPEFSNYLAQRQYQFITIKEYETLLIEAGFQNVKSTNKKHECLSALERELKFLESAKENFIQTFSEKDYAEMQQLLRVKIKRLLAGEMAWGVFQAHKSVPQKETQL